jgi:DNA-binding NarL/FixJ family response regulator
MAPVPAPASHSSSGPHAGAITITRAEKRVLAFMLQGCGNAAIADALKLSRRTVEGHVSSLLQKTGCHSRTQLVLWALGQGNVKGHTPA